ncbi:MAG TPA: DUF58 domain-containing protein, partial [Chthonomonadaceae bacterium]|nr:DUF58 domain-containing protein [Chthonomonadaceae bacterium]
LMIREPFPAWVELVEPEPRLFNVEGRSTTRVQIPVHFLKRGVYRVNSFDVTALDPLGVFAFTRRIPCDGEIVVYPMPQTMGQMPLIGRDRNGWQEFSATALRGNSVDPDGVRGYVPGDPLRHIHWRQTARTGQLSVIEFEEAQAVNLVIAIDLFRGTEYGQGLDTTLEYGVLLAATIVQQAIQQGAGVRLLVPALDESPGLQALTDTFGRGQEHLYRILDVLARAEAKSTVHLSDLIMGSVWSLPIGTTLIAISSQPEPALVEALSRFTVSGGEVALVYVDPDSFGRPDHKARGSRTEGVMADLLAVGVQTFQLRKNPYRDVMPEMTYV